MTDRYSSRAEINGVVGGLFAMAFFTALWASWTAIGYPPLVSTAIQAVFYVCSALFVVGAIRQIIVMRRSRAQSNDSHPRDRNGEGWFLLLVLAEAVLIALASIILTATGKGDYIAPAIALIVGLHFIPMAGLFRRKIDYFIGAWVCACALAAIVMMFAAALPVSLITSIVATTTACGTAAYGFYMLRELWRTRSP